MSYITVAMLDGWHPEVFVDAAKTLVNIGSNLDGQSVQFTGQTDLQSAWTGQAGDSARLASVSLANSIGTMAESCSNAGQILDSFARSIQQAKDAVASEKAKVSNLNLPIELGPDGRFKDFTIDEVSRPAPPNEIAGNALLSIIDPPSANNQIVEDKRIPNPGWPADIVSKFDSYKGQVAASNTAIEKALQELEVADGNTVGGLSTVGVSMRTAAIRPTDMNAPDYTVGDPLWNMAAASATWRYGLSGKPVPGNGVANWIGALSQPQKESSDERPWAPLSAFAPTERPLITTKAHVADLTTEQLNYAATIIGIGSARGMSDRDLQITIATALQESQLYNLNYGDRDSQGLFQQRPSYGWGTEAQIKDPLHSTDMFLDALVEVPNRETMPLTVAAQAVQHSGFPDHYAKWEPLAGELVQQLRPTGKPTSE